MRRLAPMTDEGTDLEPTPPPPVDGEVEPRFEPLREAFVRNFTELGDRGGALCVYHRGRKVVDLFGGWVDPRQGKPYGRDTLQLVFSSTKGMTAMCAHILASEGALDLEAPVSEYWPEFAAESKGSIPVAWLLSHRAGLPTVDGELSFEEALAWYPVVEALAAQRPFWEPGSTHGYHALTFGWLVGEVARRVSGLSLGRVFATRVAEPLGLEAWIGLPEELEGRVAPLSAASPPKLEDLDPKTLETFSAFLSGDSLALRALSLNGAFGWLTERGGPFNRPELHRAEVPAANGITDARSLAKMYAASIGEVDGLRLLSPEQLDKAVAVASDGPDRVLIVPSRFGLGFMLHSSFSPLLGPGSFGHSGAGGSLGFADRDAEVAFAYVMNQMRLGLAGDARTTSLIEALRVCLR